MINSLSPEHQLGRVASTTVQVSPHRTASIALNSCLSLNAQNIQILILISVKHFIVCCCYMTCLCDVQKASNHFICCHINYVALPLKTTILF